MLRFARLHPQRGAVQVTSEAAASGATALRQDVAARWFLYSAVLWLIVPGIAGLFMAFFLFFPSISDMLPMSLRPYLQFGRLRPMHVNVAIFGWLSMAYAGGMLFIVPRLTRAPLFSERLARVNVALWDLVVLGAFVTLVLGYNQGREYAEMIWGLDLLMLLCFALLTVNVWGTVLRRQEQRLYISVWNFMAASLIIVLVYGIGNVIWDTSGALYGMNDAILNYFYVHNLFNVWFTMGFLGLVFYLLPRMSGNPIWSYRLAVWGFLSVWTGQHHLLYGPGPEWLELLSVSFSIVAALPNIAFTYNFYKTMQGAWAKVRTDVPLRFLATGCVFYILTCFQGVAQSFRNFNAQIHFTNWVIGHSHLAFVASFSLMVFALVYHILPRILGRDPFERRLMEWHYWLLVGGLLTFMLTLWAAGLIQGQNWLTGGIPFIETVRAMKPYMFMRLVGGLSMGAGIAVFGYSVLRSLRPSREVTTASAGGR
ncbi:MAG: cbb3-type cytochrome c oxidase subunit I [Chloroflexi bacterium]|nr:cbb3-type cytochrome c oxidase subunit I [Chloroflexota bacterium]